MGRRCRERDIVGALQPTMLLLCLPLALAASSPPAAAAKNSIKSFGWYWAMEDGGGNATAFNERSCSAPSPCSWDHANLDFVQNSWKSPSREPSEWDASDVLELAGKGVRGVVSVTHLFTSGPSGKLLPDYAARWATYLALMKAAGALPHVQYWYPSDEPDLRMPATSLNKILAAIKAQSPGIPILLTLSNLAFNQTTGKLNYALDASHLRPTDVLTFDIYSSGSCFWKDMKAKLDVLSAFVAANNISMAVIPDATSGTFKSLGAAGNNVLNDQFYRYCAARKACVGLFPFIGGTWQDITTRPAVYASFNAIANAVKTQDWRNTAVDPPVVCDTGELYHMPCGLLKHQCNAIARGVFGYETGNRSATQAVLPERTISMVVGQIWEYKKVCREITGAAGTVECEGGSVACWIGVLGWKSKVVSCSGADVRHYKDECTARPPGGSAVDRNWTCCIRQKVLKSDDRPAYYRDLPRSAHYHPTHASYATLSKIFATSIGKHFRSVKTDDDATQSCVVPTDAFLDPVFHILPKQLNSTHCADAASVIFLDGVWHWWLGCQGGWHHLVSSGETALVDWSWAEPLVVTGQGGDTGSITVTPSGAYLFLPGCGGE